MAFGWILNKIAGDYNEKQLAKIRPLVGKINSFYEDRHALSDDQIKAKTQEFKDRLAKGETLESLLPEAFATVKQACKRMVGMEITVKGDTLTWQMVPYDVQLIGWIVLHNSKIAEMRTGEGKTLVATLPAYLNALTGNGVHIVTVNDYLASRDAEWMGYVYNRLGLTVGAVTKGMALNVRREEYAKDITYVENAELGFDYLRDNLAKTMKDRNLIWRPLNYAIIDEVDSILIDEARTPLIISQASEEPTEKYTYYAQLVTLLTPSKQRKRVKKWFLQEMMQDVKKGEVEEIEDDGDYHIDEKTKSATLSSAWIKKLEWLLKVENLYKDLWFQEIHHIENALKAQAVYHRDKDYLIKDDQILIVDENTGRVMPGRRFNQGLHQALEAKEKVKVQRESRTLATITYQNFFKQYKKLSGMTGTAQTEAEEFEQIYQLEVLQIPTNEEIIRVDNNDMVYFNQDAKWKAVVEYIKFYHQAWLPILIGTSSIQTSELVSGILNKMTLPHYVLNAKFHEQEANIVKNAGKKASIVVATNMAWRGTDIKLEAWLMETVAQNYANRMLRTLNDGKAITAALYSSYEFELTIDALEKAFNVTNEQIRKAEQQKLAFAQWTLKINFNKSKKSKEDIFAELVLEPTATKEVNNPMEYKNLYYGLFILGTEKHDSRRIDNQLRGRAWRQGDPGVSQFFVAMDDEIMRKMGGDKIQAVARLMLSKEDLENMAFTQKQFTNSIQKAQKQMEGRHFGIRKHLFDYDSVINKQRTTIYGKRDDILLRTQQEEDALATENTNKDAEQHPITFTIVDEIKHFIEEYVDGLITSYASQKPWDRDEMIDSLEQVTTMTFTEADFSDVQNNEMKLREKLVTLLHKQLEANTAKGDPVKIGSVYSRVYLTVIDKYRMEHIDEMQYLREKVWLYGYAQIDPLVIYKKESFEKFQRLLATIKKETLADIFRVDFSAQQSTDQIVQQLTSEDGTVNMMQLLKAVTSQLKGRSPQAVRAAAKAANKWDAILVENSTNQATTNTVDTEGVEVLEIDESKAGLMEGVVMAPQKLRPNDKVSVKYADGRIVETKYKKVKDDIDAGKATII